MAIPLWGVETIIYAVALWSAYSRVSKYSGVPFRENFFKNAIGGIILNLIVTAIFGMLLDFLPVIGWVGSFAMGYISLRLSGASYVKMLKALHGKKARGDIDVKKGFANLGSQDNLPQGTQGSHSRMLPPSPGQ